MMQDAHELNSRINEKYAGMSKRQKLIAEYILENFDKAAFMTALKLGEKVGTSESTVVRFAMMLGYDGYPAMQEALQEMVRHKLTTIQRMELAGDMDESMVLRQVLKTDTNNIRLTLDAIDTAVYDEVVSTIAGCRRLYIMGVRSSAPLAQFMGYYLNFMLDNVHVVTSGVNDVLEQLMHISEGDVLVCISFPRYARRTVEGAKYARERGARVVAITDSVLSPLAEFADHTLIAQSDMASFVDSLVAPLSVINALIVSLGLKKREEVSKYFGELEHIWDQYMVYMNKDL